MTAKKIEDTLNSLALVDDAATVQAAREAWSAIAAQAPDVESPTMMRKAPTYGLSWGAWDGPLYTTLDVESENGVTTWRVETRRTVETKPGEPIPDFVLEALKKFPCKS